MTSVAQRVREWQRTGRVRPRIRATAVLLCWLGLAGRGDGRSTAVHRRLPTFQTDDVYEPSHHEKYSPHYSQLYPDDDPEEVWRRAAQLVSECPASLEKY